MTTAQALKKTRINFWVHIAILAAIAAVFETGLIAKNTLAMSEQTRYIVDVAGIMLTSGLIPLAIKGFSSQMRKAAKEKREELQQLFVAKSNARVALLFIVAATNLFLYYTASNNGAFYCAILGLAALVYSYPTAGTIENSNQQEE